MNHFSDWIPLSTKKSKCFREISFFVVFFSFFCEKVLLFKSYD